MDDGSLPRGLIFLALAAAAGRNSAQIARELAVDIGSVRLWRGRWLGRQAVSQSGWSVEDQLADAPRSGKPVGIRAEQVCQIVALACGTPGQSGRPISQWTGREVAAESVARDILPAISPRHAARPLKGALLDLVNWSLESGAGPE